MRDYAEAYSITCRTNKHAGVWVVTRLRDGRLMTSGGVERCLRWVRSWGDARLND